MTVDLLSVKLKDAKRELTALKTAHTRGLGMLKLYTFVLDLDVEGRLAFWTIKIVVNLKEGQSPYPFLECIPSIDADVSNDVIDMVGIEFTNDGMSIALYFEWLASVYPADKITFYCTSQIDNCTQEWSQ